MKLLGKKIKKSKIKPEGLFLLKLFNILGIIINIYI